MELATAVGNCLYVCPEEENRHGGKNVNMIYSDICQKILGEYSEKNKYHSQLLYLLCYIGNVKKITDIDRIVDAIKELKKEVSFGIDIIYNKHYAVYKSDIQFEYGEDFDLRCELYIYNVSFDEQLIDINYRLGFKRHQMMLKDLYKICLMYCILIGEMNEVSKTMEKVQNQQKSGEDRRTVKARKAVANMEKQIRENIYSSVRNKIIGFRTTDV